MIYDLREHILLAWKADLPKLPDDRENFGRMMRDGYEPHRRHYQDMQDAIVSLNLDDPFPLRRFLADRGRTLPPAYLKGLARYHDALQEQKAQEAIFQAHNFIAATYTKSRPGEPTPIPDPATPMLLNIARQMDEADRLNALKGFEVRIELDDQAAQINLTELDHVSPLPKGCVGKKAEAHYRTGEPKRRTLTIPAQPMRLFLSLNTPCGLVELRRRSLEYHAMAQIEAVPDSDKGPRAWWLAALNHAVTESMSTRGPIVPNELLSRAEVARGLGNRRVARWLQAGPDFLLISDPSRLEAVTEPLDARSIGWPPAPAPPGLLPPLVYADVLEWPQGEDLAISRIKDWPLPPERGR